MNNIWGLLIWIIILALVVKWFKSKLPFWIGRSGEKFVNRKLAELDPNHYKVLDDLLLPSNGNTNTTQIDHVVVSSYGIFCIETKAHKGWIFGNANDQYWTQVIYKRKERFYNPLRQNYAHIKAVEELVNPIFPNARVYGFVAFPHADKLKISGTDSVGHARDVVAKISSLQIPIISDAERDKIYELLTNADIKDKAQRKEHNRNVRALKK